MKAEYPKNHQPGMAVPKGGSSCASCTYLRPELHCANEYFQKWNGGDKIPTKSADSYCSDWYEPKSGKSTMGEALQEQRARK